MTLLDLMLERQTEVVWQMDWRDDIEWRDQLRGNHSKRAEKERKLYEGEW